MLPVVSPIAKGMWTVFKEIFRGNVTEKYPKEIERRRRAPTWAGTC